MTGATAKQEWGRALMKIQDAVSAEGVAAGSGIGAFYKVNKTTTMLAVCRATEGHPDVKLGEGKEEEDFFVPVIFHSYLGYQYITSIYNGPFLHSCLQTELEKIGYKEPIDVTVEKWDLPNLPEQSMGMMGERVRGWLEGIPDNVSALLAGPSTFTSWDFDNKSALLASSTEDAEEEEDRPSQPKKPRHHLQPTAHVTGTLRQAEIQEGPLNRQRARLQQHKDSPTAQIWLKAFSCLERGAAMLTSGGYQEGEGVEHLLEGIMLMEIIKSEVVNEELYHQSWLPLDKLKLDKLISTQLQANPDNTPCLLIQALQLCEGNRRQETLNHVIDVVLQHGETDPMYEYLAHMYCSLGCTIWMTTKQKDQAALSVFASVLMHKSDLPLVLFFTAWCSMYVSIPQAIRQFHHFIHTAPTGHRWVLHAHYYLVLLYSQQDPSVHRARILHHYNMAQQTDRNRLPVFLPVPSVITDPARRVYKLVMAQPDTSDASQ